MKQAATGTGGAVAGAVRRAAACALAFAATLAAAAPAPGTAIVNQAQATAQVGALGVVSRSATVTLTVSGGASLRYSGALARSTIVESEPGATVVFPHTLTNTGEAEDLFTISAADAGNGNWSYAAVEVLPDANADGVPDHSTPLAAPQRLAVGQALAFVVRVRVPAGVPAGTQADVRVSARGAAAGAVEPIVDRVLLPLRVGPLDCAKVYKDISRDKGPSPAGPVTISLRYEACDKPRARALIVDRLPAGMKYVPGSGRWRVDGASLTLADGPGVDGERGPQKIEYQFGTPIAGAVSVTVRDIPAQEGGLIQFDVEIEAGLRPATVLTNTAEYTFYDANGQPFGHAVSNAVTYTVTGSADFELLGHRLPSVAPGATAVFTNVLTNRGDATDTYDIWLTGSTFPEGSEIALFKSDGVTPLADTDASGTPDTGPVAPGASYRILVAVKIPATAVPGAYKVVKNARAASMPSRTRSADDAVDAVQARCSVAFEPDHAAQVGFGHQVTYAHRLANRGNCDEVVTAGPGHLADESAAWTSGAYLDNAAGAGSVAGAVDASDSRIEPGWSRRLAPGESARILVRVTAPANEQAAQLAKAAYTNVTRLTLASQSGPLAVRDTTTVDTRVSVPTPENVIRNHVDPGYAAPTLYGVIGSYLYLRADARVCNADPSSAETRTVVITGPGGERETATAVETGPDTGIFTVAPLPVRAPPVVRGNGTLEGRAADVFEIELLGCGRTIQTTVTLIQATSVVFDSRSNEPVAGATVSLVIAQAGACTAQPLSHGGSPVGPFVTGADGRFALPQLPRGAYCVKVQAPNGYRFASRVPWPELPQPRNLVVSGLTSGGSYGGVFELAHDTALAIDIPVDAAAQDGLFVQKAASRAVVELGDFLEYSVRVRNGTGNSLDRAQVMLADDLPRGFSYVAGTARRDGRAIADPAGGAGPRLTLALGAMRGGEEVTVTYRVRVGPGSMQGDGVNRVQASYAANGATTVSNVATARVQVTGGVFTDKGFILGRVFADCNANGVVDGGEKGVAGVRVVLEDGTYVITDGAGKFSFYGIANRTHVVKVDRTTLPAGARLAATSARHLGDGASRIVDLKASELHRADFAIAGCGEALAAEIERRAKAAGRSDEISAMMGAQLATEARIVGDVKALPASGVVQAAPAAAAPRAAPAAGPFQPAAPAAAAERPSPAPRIAAPAAAEVAQPLEELLPSLDPTLGFVGLADGQTLAASQATVRVKGSAGATFRLAVNGAEVSEKQVGKRAVLAEQRVQAWEYFGVDLKAGVNRLTVSQKDAFGNPRGEASIAVRVPGRLAKIAVEAPAGAVADGKTAATVVVKLLDADGTPVAARVPVTITATLGRWQSTDLEPAADGLQVMVEGGRGEVALLPPVEPGAAALVVEANGVKAEARVDFLPELRRLIAAGVVEGIVNFRKLAAGAIQPVGAGDAFEQELRHLAKDFGDGEGHAGARAAFYLKGKVKGEYLLTAAYDSDKDTRQRLFRDIQPDEFYPIYGDSGVRGFDAQSTSRLYVRVDHRRSYLLWGDFTTQAAGETRKLSNYSRSLTGLKHHYENGRVSANVFASRDSSRQVIEELRANGTSGPYQLDTRGALVGSEKVEIVTRDRNQPALIVSSLPQARFADYEIETVTGRILFKAPVPSVDRDLNPVFVRVTYEVDQGGEKFWVAGVDAQVRLGARVEVGGVYVRDENPLLPFTLAGANATVKLAEGTFVVGEVARTERGVEGVTGDAARIEVKHESKSLRGNAFYARSDVGFDNPGAALTQGRSEAGGKLDYKLSERTTVRAEALRTEDVATHAVREGLAASLQHRVGERFTLELGVRHAAEKGSVSPVPAVPNPDGSVNPPQPMPEEVTTVRGRVTAALPFVKGASVYGEAEVDVNDADRRILAAGGEYALGAKGRIYARHQFQSSITGPYGLNAAERQNTTAIGVDTEYMKDGRVFSEYRIRDAMSGGDVEAALGLKNLWSIAPGLRAGTTFERVESLSGAGQNENTAVTLALEYTGSERWKGSARLEVRDGTQSDSLLFTAGLAAKVSRDFTALARNTFTLQKNADGSEHRVDRFQAGLAWRDHDTNKWNALARVESRFEHNPLNAYVSEAVAATPGSAAAAPQGAPELKRTTHMFSVHADWQPIRPFLVTGRYAAKWTSDTSGGVSSKHVAQAVGGRATWEFAPKWDVGLAASVLMGEGGARQYAIGVEVGYLLATNLWVSAGYNFAGYKDADLSFGENTAKGAYVRLRYKFDESLVESFVPGMRSAAQSGVKP